METVVTMCPDTVENVQNLIEPGAPATVYTNAADCERGLRALWQYAARRQDGGGERALTRACTMNLLYLDVCEEVERPDAGDADDTLVAVSRHYPARILRVSRSGAMPPDALELRRSAYCHTTGGDSRLVCCEELHICGGTSATDRIASTVPTLLISDVPVLLWLTGPPDVTDPLVSTLLDYATHCVVDSREFRSPDGLSSLAPLVDREYPIVTDLNWQGSRVWRVMEAHIFDPVVYRPYTDAINRAHIIYAGEPGADTSSQARLFGAWLADRLGWVPAESESSVANGGCQWRLQCDGAERTVLLEPTDATLAPPGNIVSVRLEAPLGDPPMVFLLEPMKDARDGIVLRIETAGTCSLPTVMPMGRDDRRTLLIQAFGTRRRHPLFERALRLLQELAK